MVKKAREVAIAIEGVTQAAKIPLFHKLPYTMAIYEKKLTKVKHIHTVYTVYVSTDLCIGSHCIQIVWLRNDDALRNLTERDIDGPGRLITLTSFALVGKMNLSILKSLVGQWLPDFADLGLLLFGLMRWKMRRISNEQPTCIYI